MGAIKLRAPFRVLAVSEQKSIGRERFETSFTIKQLAEASVEAWFYSERAVGSPTGFVPARIERS